MRTKDLTEQQVMTSIERVALRTKYSAEQIDNLMEIANATPNSTLAIEIMLDIYEEPTFKQHTLRNDDPNCECEFIRFDKWAGKVWFEYTTEKTCEFRIDKDTDTSMITYENYKEYEVDYNHNNSKWFTVLTGQTKVVTDSTNVSNYRKMEQDHSKWFQLCDDFQVDSRGHYNDEIYGEIN